jgi:hypothetical protein
MHIINIVNPQIYDIWVSLKYVPHYNFQSLDKIVFIKNGHTFTKNGHTNN